MPRSRFKRRLFELVSGLKDFSAGELDVSKFECACFCGAPLHLIRISHCIASPSYQSANLDMTIAQSFHIVTKSEVKNSLYHAMNIIQCVGDKYYWMQNSEGEFA